MERLGVGELRDPLETVVHWPSKNNELLAAPTFPTLTRLPRPIVISIQKLKIQSTVFDGSIDFIVLHWITSAKQIVPVVGRFPDHHGLRCTLCNVGLAFLEGRSAIA